RYSNGHAMWKGCTNTDDDANISGLEANFPTRVDDDLVAKAMKLNWKMISVVLEEDEDMRLFGNICDQMVYRDMGEKEMVDQLFLGDLVDNELTKDDAIGSSCSNVPIGGLRKRKIVEYDKTDLG
ncbi:hypothetical protein Tco_1477315, partial [Tanacetum coccineum]